MLFVMLFVMLFAGRCSIVDQRYEVLLVMFVMLFAMLFAGRCSIVDQKGEVLFDRFVQPSETITDYRTRWSGLRPKNIRRGIPFLVAQQQIAALIKVGGKGQGRGLCLVE